MRTQDADLFLELAGIAGVFVGFGALLAVRSGGASDPRELVYIRSVVWVGLWVVIAGLAPVIVSRYGVSGHALWLACSLLALGNFIGLLAVNRRTPEHWQDAATYSRAMLIRIMPVPMLLIGALVVVLGLVVLGPFHEHEPALYLTAVALGLLMGATSLLILVFAQRQPMTSSVPSMEVAPGRA